MRRPLKAAARLRGGSPVKPPPVVLLPSPFAKENEPIVLQFDWEAAFEDKGFAEDT